MLGYFYFCWFRGGEGGSRSPAWGEQARENQRSWVRECKSRRAAGIRLRKELGRGIRCWVFSLKGKQQLRLVRPGRAWGQGLGQGQRDKGKRRRRRRRKREGQASGIRYQASDIRHHVK